MSPLLQQVLRHLNALRSASDGDDAVGGAGQRLGDLDPRAALRADLADAGPRLTDYCARQLQTKKMMLLKLILKVIFLIM